MSTDSTSPAALSACHAALQNADILSIVFDAMVDITSPDGWGSFKVEEIDHRTCARCARVCSWFREPATRALWSRPRKGIGLSPLFAILCPLPACSHRGLCYAAILEGKSYLDPVRWQRFLQRGAMIRVIRYYRNLGAADAENERQLFRALIHHNGSLPFLPALHTVEWVDGLDDTDDILSSVISSPLRQLSLEYTYGLVGINQDSPAYTRILERTLSVIAACSPSIARLYMRQPCEHPPALPSELGPRFRNLRILDMVTCPAIAFALPSICGLLATAPLEELKIQVRGWIGARTHTLPTPVHARHLRTLECEGTCRDLADLAAVLRAPGLTFAILDIVDQPRMALSDYLGCIHSIASYSPSLRTFAIRDGDPAYLPGSHVPEGHMRWADVLGPCLSLRHIEHLQLSCIANRFAFSMDDDNAAAFAQAMPRLRELTLSASCMDARLPSPRALVHFAAFCPALTYLELVGLEPEPIPDPRPDVRHVPASPAAPYLTQHFWLKLGVARTPVADFRRLAAFLHSFFPNLVLIEFEDPHDNSPEAVDSWEGVRKELISLQSERKAAASEPARATLVHVVASDQV